MKLGAVLVMVTCVTCVVGISACKQEPSAAARAAPGKERGDCRADKTCDPGLLCLSGLCVRPPPADCEAVGEHLTSLELGNYAEPEDRAPVVARYKAACEKGYVSKEQGACIEKTDNKWAAMECAPEMFPETKASGTGDCGKVVAKLRAAFARQAPAVLDPQTQTMMAKAMNAIKDSCEQDGWPAALKRCILESSDTADAMTACDQQVPPALKTKMTERMMNAMQ